MAVILLTATFLMGTRLTPNGIHCPTAQVQIVNSADGPRAPLAHEKGFKQCLCKERQAKAETSALNSGVMLVFTAPQCLEAVPHPLIEPGCVIPHMVIGSLPMIPAFPLLPPPDLV